MSTPPDADPAPEPKTPEPNLADILKAQNELLSRLAPKPTAPAPSEPKFPEIPAVTQDELDQASQDPKLLLGLIDRQATATLNRGLAKFEHEKLKPLEEQGRRGFADLAARAAQVNPYYQQHKAEIDEIIASSFSGFEHDPAVFDEAIIRHRGLNHDRLVKESNDTLLAKIRSGESEVPGLSIRTAGASTGDTIPSAQALVEAGRLNPGALSIIKRNGGEEAFAKKVSGGRRNWKEYVIHQGLFTPPQETK